MGNVPGKIDQEEGYNDFRPNSSNNASSLNADKQYDDEITSRVRTRHTTSLVNNILSGNNTRSRASSNISGSSRRKTSQRKGAG